MARNNFVSEKYEFGTIGFGEPVINSSLTNPLTSSIQCYSPDANRTSNTILNNNYFISNSNCINISLGKSISQRIWVRVSNNQQYNIYRIGLMSKHSLFNSGFFGTSDLELRPLSGYEFCLLGDSDYYGNSGGLRFRAGGVNNTQVQTYINGTLIINSWLGLRMDVIPVVGTGVINGAPAQVPIKDIVKLYTATRDAPENWTLVYTKDILFGSDEYVPWGKYKINTSIRYVTTNEFNTYSGTEIDSYNGFGYYRNNNNYNLYWDDYKIYII